MFDVLHLKREKVLLGTLTACNCDQPFFFCHFEPTVAFDEVKPLFKLELELLNTPTMEGWEAAYEKILALGLRLVGTVETNEFDDFLLHIEGNKAWFRY